MRLTPSHQFIAVTALSLLIVSGAGFVFWRLSESVVRNDAAVSEIRSRIDGFVQERAAAKALGAILVKRQDDLVRIGRFFIDRRQPVAFLEALEALARATGNAVVIELDEGRSDRQYLGFRITVDDDWQGILHYVELFEKMPYVIEIQEITYQNLVADSSRKISGPSGRLIVSFRVGAR